MSWLPSKPSIQAKLEPDTQRRAILLDAAARRLLEARHYMALARVILLRARNCGGGEIARTLRKQFSRCRRDRCSGFLPAGCSHRHELAGLDRKF